MKHAWLAATLIFTLCLVCLGAEKKKDKKAEAEAPPVAKKTITGYRAGTWGMPQDKVMAKETSRHKDVQDEPDYVVQLGVPPDVKALIPESGKLPRRAPFRNFEAILEVEAAECRVTYYFFEDKLYMIWCRESLLRHIMNFKNWKQQMLEQFGAPTAENSDGSIVWDQDLTYCTVKPEFSGSGQHTETTLLESYLVFMYDKKAKKQIIQWMKDSLHP